MKILVVCRLLLGLISNCRCLNGFIRIVGSSLCGMFWTDFRMLKLINIYVKSSKYSDCFLLCCCGWLIDYFSIAASITAAPVSIVDMKLSWPGQSQKDICRSSSRVSINPSFSHFGLSSSYSTNRQYTHIFPQTRVWTESPPHTPQCHTASPETNHAN